MIERTEDATPDPSDAPDTDTDTDAPDTDTHTHTHTHTEPHRERWLVVNGRRWRRTDPALPSDVVEALKSHLGRGRSGVGAAKRAGDADAVAAARVRVGLAKNGLGERGPYWWDSPAPERLARAREALERLDALDHER